MTPHPIIAHRHRITAGPTGRAARLAFSLGVVVLLCALDGCASRPVTPPDNLPGVATTIRTQTISGAVPFTAFLEAIAIVGGRRIPYRGNVGGVGVSRYAWDFGDGTTATGESRTVNHRYDEAGDYVITLRTHFTDGRRATDRRSMKAHPPRTVYGAGGGAGDTAVDGGGQGSWRENLPELFEGFATTLGTRGYRTLHAPAPIVPKPAVDDRGHAWISREIYKTYGNFADTADTIRALFEDVARDVEVVVIDRPSVSRFLQELAEGIGDSGSSGSGSGSGDTYEPGDTVPIEASTRGTSEGGVALGPESMLRLGELATADAVLVLELEVNVRALGVTPHTFSGRLWRCRADHLARVRLLDVASATVAWYNTARWSTEFDVENR